MVDRPIPLGSEDLRFFVVVANAPSLAAASRSLDVSRSAVTQRLAQSESRLRCRLWIEPPATSGLRRRAGVAGPSGSPVA